MPDGGRPSRVLLDELAISSLPPRTIALVDGWLLRAAPDLPFRRCSAAVRVPAAAGGPVPLDAAASFARRWDVAARVVIADDPTAAADDAAAAAAGWEVEAPVDVLVGPVGAVVASVPEHRRPQVELAPDPTWLEEVGGALDVATALRAAAYGRALARAAASPFAVVARDGGAVIGLALGSVDRGAVSLFGLAVHPDARRRGAGAQLSAAVARVGDELGAAWLWLQVERANAGAHALYGRLGLMRSHGYHYRTDPSTRR